MISKERRGDYLGKTVQVVPHVTDAIIDWVERVSKQAVSPDQRAPDVCVIELGGTIGDIEGEFTYIHAILLALGKIKCPDGGLIKLLYWYYSYYPLY